MCGFWVRAFSGPGDVGTMRQSGGGGVWTNKMCVDYVRTKCKSFSRGHPAVLKN